MCTVKDLIPSEQTERNAECGWNQRNELKARRSGKQGRRNACACGVVHRWEGRVNILSRGDGADKTARVGVSTCLCAWERRASRHAGRPVLAHSYLLVSRDRE